MEPLPEACKVEGLGKGVTQDRGVVSYEVPPVAYLPHRGTTEHLSNQLLTPPGLFTTGGPRTATQKSGAVRAPAAPGGPWPCPCPSPLRSLRGHLAALVALLWEVLGILLFCVGG